MMPGLYFMNQTPAEEAYVSGLKQELGLAQGVGLLSTSLLGTGVFAVPALAAQLAQYDSLWAWPVLILGFSDRYRLCGFREALPQRRGRRAFCRNGLWAPHGAGDRLVVSLCHSGRSSGCFTYRSGFLAGNLWLEQRKPVTGSAWDAIRDLVSRYPQRGLERKHSDADRFPGDRAGGGYLVEGRDHAQPDPAAKSGGCV